MPSDIDGIPALSSTSEEDEEVYMDAESYWKDLPRGAKEYTVDLVDSTNMMPFIIGIESYFTLDKDYHWNLPKALRATCIISADFLIKGNNDKAILMIFYSALIRECLARGFWDVHNLLRRTWEYEHHPKEVELLANHWVRDGESEASVLTNEKLFFSEFNFLHSTVESVHSRRTMAIFLCNWLACHRDYADGKYWLHLMQVKTNNGEFCPNPILHSIGNDTLNTTPKSLMILRILFPEIDMYVYGDTVSNMISLNIHHSIDYTDQSFTKSFMQKLKWVFQYCFAGNKSTNFYKGKDKVPRKQGLCLLNDERKLYLVTNSNKTLSELGVQDGDVYQVALFLSVLIPSNVDMDSIELKFPNGRDTAPQVHIKNNDGDVPKTVKRKVKKHKKTKRKRNKNPKREKELDLDTLRQLHSKAMEPTFDEMRPILKKIRDKLTALTLQKTVPKLRKKVVGEGRENELTSSIINLSLVDDTSGSKAGKTVYPILVGEPANLFKTRQLRSSKMSHITTLDLHGCSRYKALGLLRKGLIEWVDKAMQGDYVRCFCLLDTFSFIKELYISSLSLFAIV